MTRKYLDEAAELLRQAALLTNSTDPDSARQVTQLQALADRWMEIAAIDKNLPPKRLASQRQRRKPTNRTSPEALSGAESDPESASTDRAPNGAQRHTQPQQSASGVAQTDHTGDHDGAQLAPEPDQPLPAVRRESPVDPHRAGPQVAAREPHNQQ